MRTDTQKYVDEKDKKAFANYLKSIYYDIFDIDI